MSRTNPNKKKRRSAKATLLVFGEGLCEEMFLKHLRKLYAYDSGLAVTIMKGKGGTAHVVVIDADRAEGAFDRKVVVLDNDKNQAEMEKLGMKQRSGILSLLRIHPAWKYFYFPFSAAAKRT